MTTLAEAPAPLDPTRIRGVVEARLRTFLDHQEAVAEQTPELRLFTGILREQLAAGGKRVRPLFCVTGWHAVRDDPPPDAVWRTAASLELFHAFALIHDDIMDASDTRRGQPTAHKVLAALHPDRPDTVGTSAAMLLGDLALGWSYELLHAPGLTDADLRAVWDTFSALRTETLIGQYLDLTGRPVADATVAWRIIRYKTSKYTIERPLQLGARLAGASTHQLRALTGYALPLGEAFQLRDDLLGVFGDPAKTGKPTLDDLREGKHTVLIATALRLARPSQQRLLARCLGDPALTEHDAEAVRSVLVGTGATSEIEHLIHARRTRALDALTDAALRPTAVTLLRTLARTVTHRTT
ncbi:polyprenyl synthetase family protein [Streptomyces sp. SID4919]|nr:polyprenyl synthetase family protein [Streptomyces sp. SID4919]SCK43196.1 geranylgeranyl diphosphate synthase, type I [Streptomyces sp. AmelKG-E11A]